MLQQNQYDTLQCVADTLDYPYLLAPSQPLYPAPPSTIVFNLDSVFLNNCQATQLPITDTLPLRQSIFIPHQLPLTSNATQTRPVQHYSVILLSSLIIIAFLTVLFHRNHHLSLSQAFYALISKRNFQRLRRQHAFTTTQQLLPIIPLFAATIALIVFAAISQISLQLPLKSTTIAVIIFAATTLLLLLRIAAIQLLSSVFSLPNAAPHYIAYSLIAQLLATSLSLIILLFLSFLSLPPLLFIILAATPAVAALVATLIQIPLAAFIDQNKSNLFFIYYLCILEIVPLIVLVKLLISF